jgi:hypothetical protein
MLAFTRRSRSCLRAVEVWCMSSHRLRHAFKSAITPVIVKSSRRATILGRAIRYAADLVSARVSATRYEERFLKNADVSRYDRSVRTAILERFKQIDREMNMLTSPSDGLFLAEALLSIECPGAVVECGCFNGGSTAKLSIIAKITGRPMLAFDSFQGLPADAYHTSDFISAARAT